MKSHIRPANQTRGKMKLKTILKIGILCLVIVVAVILLSPLAAQAASIALVITQGNPIIQTKYTADPAPLVYNDTVYLYTSHDEDNAIGFTMYNWLLYSSTDLVNWTDHGIIGGVAAPYKTFAWADGVNAWAPQVVYRNGKFYLYGPFPKGGHMVIGVAVANSPTGPFVDAIGAPLINNPSSTNDIDPTVFIDDDGQAYLYWGHQPPVYYVKLNQDMISYSGGIVQLTKPQTYEEGPWLYKRNGQYYLAFASTCCPEGIGYAMSSSPTGPWTYKGSIMDGNALSSGNHPGIIDYKGSSYVFGFNYAVQLQREGSRLGERRSVCLDKMTYNADGTIQKLPFWSQTGVSQIGNLNPYVQNEAETIAWAWDVKTEPCSEGGMDVGNIENGDFIKVKGVNFGSGAASFDARVASATSGGNIELRLDDTAGTLVGTCAVPGTGGWQTWVTKTCAVSGATGIHDLYFRFTGGSGSLFNFNWWKFNASGGGPTPTKTNTPVGPTPTAVRTNTPGPTPTTGSFPVPGAYYRLINRNSGKVVEVSNFSTADGGNVQQWTSTGTSSQQWSFVSVGGGYYNIINRNSGKCLDVNGASTADGANVQQWTCGSGTNQRWQLIAVGSYYELKAQHSGKALDVVGNGTADGVNVDQWTWNSGNNQQWQIIP
jgi:hypothetical protein